MVFADPRRAVEKHVMATGCGYHEAHLAST
jgi:hypothetical protein